MKTHKIPFNNRVTIVTRPVPFNDRVSIASNGEQWGLAYKDGRIDWVGSTSTLQALSIAQRIGGMFFAPLGWLVK